MTKAFNAIHLIPVKFKTPSPSAWPLFSGPLPSKNALRQVCAIDIGIFQFKSALICRSKDILISLVGRTTRLTGLRATTFGFAPIFSGVSPPLAPLRLVVFLYLLPTMLPKSQVVIRSSFVKVWKSLISFPAWTYPLSRPQHHLSFPRYGLLQSQLASPHTTSHVSSIDLRILPISIDLESKHLHQSKISSSSL